MAQKREEVLMFCPAFFGYENRIAQAFRDAGFDVCLYDERPNKSFICKAALRFNLKFYKSFVTKYVKKNKSDMKMSLFILVYQC